MTSMIQTILQEKSLQPVETENEPDFYFFKLSLDIFIRATQTAGVLFIYFLNKLSFHPFYYHISATSVRQHLLDKKADGW